MNARRLALGGCQEGDLRLGTNLEVNPSSGSLGIIDSLGTSLDIGAHTVVVAGGESRSIAQTVDGYGVVGSAEADGTGVTGDATLSDVVGSLSTNEESVTAENGVSSECWTLIE